MRLDRYTVGQYSPGAPLWQQVAWYYLGLPIVKSHWIVGSGFKCTVLRWFGAQIGEGVRIKPGLKIKFPWRLVVGDFVWLGEDCWIDNVAMVTIDTQTCISQGVYLCTGNHDWSSPTFDLKDLPIHIGSGCWIAAKATIGPGVTVGDGAVLCLGSVTGRSLDPMTVYAGNPAQPIKQRKIAAIPDAVLAADKDVS
ncbi:WcaF family extracellular polysaccharide biosynthesis acetyltransferase [Chamaesiphon sp. VAR_48_metabat_403]|uniref:WcaF family extracellular polysaccharide biosynthesis acetyltransferase n=1 Tax=Chamaesiphon sp. VAR_48_metabat_403 TaxID=2964700 RepID=UPI00286E0ED2|nr:WcaF family extracellular polysaccharide biosynthesis acetyltransferase [Chamaesiphon sp. VAR_48_metabat_403]